jgi:hypothetical protein
MLLSALPSSLARHALAALAVVAGLLLTTVKTGAEETAADIPIKRVVMFSSGVAFFEHQGQVEGNAEVDLKFNVKSINDLLKSLVLQDLGGGKISTVSYGSKEPITRTLATFAIDLTSNPTLADLLGQIRGEQIEIDAPTKIVGKIIGIEKHQLPVGKDSTIEVPFVVLLTDAGLRSVSLENVGRIKLTNPKLDVELRQALEVLAAGKSQDKKTVSLNFLGNGKRPVRIGYIQEAPIWKTSYRLVLDDKDPPFLQGWAIVENTTESDWDNVGLTLVSGRPISFTMDLYQPLFVQRPQVKPELYASLRPRTYDQDLAEREQEFRAAGEQPRGPIVFNSNSRERSGRAAAPPAPGAAGAMDRYAFGANGGEDAKAKRNAALDIRQGGQTMAQAGDVGELFRYTIATPVTLERSKSAMLPIVNESVAGEKLSIYNEATQAKHPLNGLRLKNTTDLHLMQGPITVFDGGTYAGDAQIQDLPPGSERLISYAIDLDTEVAPKSDSQPQQLVSVRLVKGTLYTSNKLARTKTFVVKNSSAKAKKLLIEYPLETPWKLLAPQEPAEKTRDMYRFALTAEPGQPATLEVKEEQTVNQQIAITNLNDDAILVYIRSEVVSPEVKKALQEVIDRKAAIAKSAAHRQELERQIAVIEQEQKRIRDNMAQLPKDSDLFRRYIAKFTGQEDQVDTLRGQVTDALKNEQKLRQDLDKFLGGLDLK